MVKVSFRKSWYSEKITAGTPQKTSCSEEIAAPKKTTLVANSYFEEMGRGGFSENKAALKKLRNLREGKINLIEIAFPERFSHPEVFMGKLT